MKTTEDYANKWRNIVFSTDSIDKSKAEAAIREGYQQARLQLEKITFWDSPVQIHTELNRINTNETSVISKVYYHKLYHFTSYNLDGIELLLRNWWSYPNSLNTLQQAAGYNHHCDVMVRPAVLAMHDYNLDNYFAMHDYNLDNYSLDNSVEEIEMLLNIGREIQIAVIHEHSCYISNRPSKLAFNDVWQVHCEDGPAISFRDGTNLWAINGVVVDEQIVLAPETQRVNQINIEESVEVKRVRIERYGWEKYLCKTNARIINKRRNDIECTKEALIKIEDMTVLLCHCPSTGRIYTMEVPHDTQSCEEAQNYLWGGSSLAEDVKILGRS